MSRTSTRKPVWHAETKLHAHPGRPHVPVCFGRADLDADQAGFVAQQAMAIFTSMANAGHSFSACLGAIYLTGLKDAIDSGKRAEPLPAPASDEATEGGDG